MSGETITLAGRDLDDAHVVTVAAMLDASLSLEETGPFQMGDLETLIDGARVLSRLVDTDAGFALGYLCGWGDRGILDRDQTDRLGRLVARHRGVFEMASAGAEIGSDADALYLLEIERAERLLRRLTPAAVQP